MNVLKQFNLILGDDDSKTLSVSLNQYRNYYNPDERYFKVEVEMLGRVVQEKYFEDLGVANVFFDSVVNYYVGVNDLFKE